MLLLLNIDVGEYLMVRTPAKPKHELQSKWHGPMLPRQSKSNLVFVVEERVDARRLIVHAQSMLPYPGTKSTKQTYKDLKHQALHFDAGYHLVDEIVWIQKREGKIEVLIKLSGLDEDVDRTWRQLNIIHEDVPGVLEDILQTFRNRSMKREVLSLYFK